jgi:1,4-dihydroxy-2-naphthoyl-CoA hydrolase
MECSNDAAEDGGVSDKPFSDAVASEATVSATQRVRELIPLCRTLGVRVHTYEPRQIRLALDWTPELCTSGGLLHGGIVMALADSAGALCAYLNLPDGADGTATIEAKSNFLTAIGAGTALATARPLHVGSRTVVVEVETRDLDGRLVAKTLATQAVLQNRMC